MLVWTFCERQVPATIPAKKMDVNGPTETTVDEEKAQITYFIHDLSLYETL
jgi:hypothetical protein